MEKRFVKQSLNSNDHRRMEIAANIVRIVIFPIWLGFKLCEWCNNKLNSVKF